MNPEQWRDIKAVLLRAMELAPADRGVYLESYSSEVRHEVESLLAAYERNEAFLEVPCPEGPMVSTPADQELAGRQFGPYRLLSLLGQGGMGSVWLAERVDGMFTRQVAIKLVHPALMGRMMTERVARERAILASLNHPNIARLFDAGFADDGQPYLALEYVSGTPFTTYCDERRLSIRARLGLFRQVLGAVQYAHTHLVIHRDLKPSNVLVTEAGQVQLLDFGIAKLLSEGEAKATELTQLGGRPLTLDYAAPEQITATSMTTSADVYALGVILYETLTGERPYRLKRGTRAALEEAILQVDPVAPSRAALGEEAATARGSNAKKLSKDLAGDLDVITIKALKKSPKERYQTASALDEDIGRYLNAEVVLAQPDSLAYRANKFARRHWVAITVVSILLLTLAAGLAATSYEARVASAQRDVALQAQLRSLTQTSVARLKDGDVPGALGIALEVLQRGGLRGPQVPEALSVFQEARAADAQMLAFTGHTDSVHSARFSADGQLVVTGSNDLTARIWDVATGQQIRVLRGHTGPIFDASFSADAHYVVTASADKTACIWDATSGEKITSLRGHTGTVWSAAISGDGRYIVTASGDKTSRIWDSVTGRQSMVLIGHTDAVHWAAFSPDGRKILTASSDRTARVWDAASGRQIMQLEGHTGRLWRAAFSNDGLRIVTSSEDGTARVWDAATGQLVAILNGHTSRVLSAAFSPDGRRVVTASEDRTARIWDAATGKQLLLLVGYASRLNIASFSPDGQRLVVGSYDTTARILSVASGEQLTLRHTDRVYTAAYSPDGRRLVTSSWDNSARIWDAMTGEQILLLSGHSALVVSAAFSPDGARIVTASADMTARLWNATTGQPLNTFDGHAGRVWFAAFSPDGGSIVTASDDKTARVWNSFTGKELLRLTGHTERVVHAAFSPDGRRIVTSSTDKTARVWNAGDGRQLLVLSGEGEIESADFSPDGKRIVTTSNDQSASVWDAVTGQQQLRLTGHRDTVGSGAFSADGKRIVTASFDRTARIWDALTGEQLRVLSGHSDFVQAASFAPDGRRVVTASDDKTARIWDARDLPLKTQIDWVAAAQLDPLQNAERVKLGLPSPPDVRQWPPDRSKCDELAAAFYDSDRRAQGVTPDKIVPDLAVGACSLDNPNSRSDARRLYQHGRALMIRGDLIGARRDLEQAVDRGYRSAMIDLARLLSGTSTQVPDVARAIGLYETAWKNGVAIGGFELGALYENGVTSGDNERGHSLTPDQAKAWFWYRKAAKAGEPHALARVAEKDGLMALADQDATKKNSLLLESFEYYAAAVERARIEDWPDEVFKNWRYRRASLARLLAREGMVQEVADVYERVVGRSAPDVSGASKQLASLRGAF
jgi:WD40 repeat protein/serine/threonine protein kinase